MKIYKFKVLKHKTIEDNFGITDLIYPGKDDGHEILHCNKPTDLLEEGTTIEDLREYWRYYSPTVFNNLEDYDLKTVELKIID